jgi:predicted GIY-YIG superfamily endonuclease
VASDLPFEAVEQPRKHSGLVGSSILPLALFQMAWVYILRGLSGRHYIGSTADLDARFAQHLRGHTATTKRLGDTLEIVAKKEVPTLAEARKIERSLKQKKNPKLAVYHLQR